MAEIRVNPTRMELKKLQVRLLTSRRGHKLLKDKRDELMRQFLDIVREDKELRERVEKKLSEYYADFSVAAAVSSPKMLKGALILPRREGSVEVSQKNVMSVMVPEFSLDVRESGDSINYGLAFTTAELDGAIGALGEVLEDMVRLAELEKTAQLMAQEIEQTRRRVNALEHIMIPRYEAGIKSIKMKLEENERGNLTRLMKVKDMMVKAQLENR
ncbi:MAG: V-type ATP synthase subunit D [Clostridia bacterium]|nr:V-type ATP synthase subunit D [Clostridia bacterium]